LRQFTVVLIGLLLLASTALALDVTVRSFCDDVGVRLSLTAKTVSMQPGQTIATAKITHPDRLSTYGMAATATGDEVTVTYNGGKSFALKHARSGKQVTIQPASMN
jgi:hypothetical protein